MQLQSRNVDREATAVGARIAVLRIIVGMLGERADSRFWDSQFFQSDSSAFLAPVFQRTEILSKTLGTSRAAAICHDDRIGMGEVCHLFRLPWHVEERIHGALSELPSTWIESMAPTTDRAMALLAKEADGQILHAEGPVRIGRLNDVYGQSAWKKVAGYYLGSLEGETEVFPFFSDQR